MARSFSVRYIDRRERTFGLYYEWPSRPCKRYRFIRVYNSKTLHMWARSKPSPLYHSRRPAWTSYTRRVPLQRAIRRIKAAVEATPYYDLNCSAPLLRRRSFAATDLKKTSQGGMMGYRYLDLSKILPSFDPRKIYNTDEMAAALRGLTWE